MCIRDRQKTSLGKRATFHQSIQDAMESCDGNAVIFSNELVDAFPVRLFQKNETAWQEIHLDHSNGTTREIFISPTSLPDSSIFKLNLSPGQRVEVHESYHQWLKSWLPDWKRGEMLTIDYGDEAETLYHRKPQGSLRGYLLHQHVDGHAIYQNPGQQDLTADVNFTDLIEWSSPWLESNQPTAFSNFIQPFCKEYEAHLLLAAEHFRYLLQSPVKPS